MSEKIQRLSGKGKAAPAASESKKDIKAPAAKTAPAKAAPAKIEKAAKVAPAKAAPAAKPEKAKSDKPRVSRAENRAYKVLVKDNPFREGTRRNSDGRWALITANKSTAAVQAENERCGSTFWKEMVGREIIAYTD